MQSMYSYDAISPFIIVAIPPFSIEWHPAQGTGRTQGGQHKRWTDVFDEFFKAECDLDKGLWRAVASNTAEWKMLEKQFVKFVSS